MKLAIVVRAFALTLAFAALASAQQCDRTQAQLTATLDSAVASLTSGINPWTAVQGKLNFTSQYGGGFGSNPSGRYGIYWLPDPTGAQSGSWKLSVNEAIVWVGCTPPPAAYFSYRSYLYQKNSGPRPALVFASLGDSNNQLTAKSTGSNTGNPFGKSTAVISTADVNTFNAIRAALVSAGLPLGAINVDVVPSKLPGVTMGTGPSSDDFTYLMRVSVFQDQTQGDLYLGTEWKIYKLTAPTGAALNPYSTPQLRPRGTGTTENAYANSVQQVQQAITSLYTSQGYTLTSTVPLTPNNYYGYTCIATNMDCAGDNRDAQYQGMDNSVTMNSGRRIVVVGVNSQLTGKATYTNLAVNSMGSGIVAIDSRSYPGSATRYAPSVPDVDKLYAIDVVRSCGLASYCLEVPSDISVLRLNARLYLEPPTKTAPLPEEVITANALIFDLP